MVKFIKTGDIITGIEIDLDAEEGEKCWLVVKEVNREGETGIAMVRDMFGDMTLLEGDGELLVNERFTEDEAEAKCYELAEITGLPYFRFDMSIFAKN